VNFHEHGYCEYGSRCNFIHQKNHKRLDCFDKIAEGKNPTNVPELLEKYKNLMDFLLL